MSVRYHSCEGISKNNISHNLRKEISTNSIAVNHVSLLTVF